MAKQSNIFENMTPEQVEAEYQRKREMAFSPEVLRRKKKKAAPTSELTDLVIKEFKAVGEAARRVNSQGQWDSELQRFRHSGMKRGYEDVDGTLPVVIITADGQRMRLGLKVAVEVKYNKDRMDNDKQIERMNELRNAGAFYLIAKNIESFRSSFKTLINELNKKFGHAS